MRLQNPLIFKLSSNIYHFTIWPYQRTNWLYDALQINDFEAKMWRENISERFFRCNHDLG